MKTRIRIIKRFKNGKLSETKHIPEKLKGWGWFKWWSELEYYKHVAGRRYGDYSFDYAKFIIDNVLNDLHIESFEEDYIDYPEENMYENTNQNSNTLNRG